MCGIVGYIGKRDAYPVLIKGLKRLEYRGYDSAGVALIDKKRRLNVYKTKGKVSDLEAFVSQKDVSGTIGIAHTRWATHGEPCQANAHPHFSSSENLALIHNGIIENYSDIIREYGLADKLVSETDSEVVAALLDTLYDGDPIAAIRKAVKIIAGSFALCIMFADRPGIIYAVRNVSPMVAAHSEEGSIIASDLTAIISFSKDYFVVPEYHILTMTQEGIRVEDLKGNEVKPQMLEITWDITAAQKGGFPHFMLKEIYEQPESLRNTITPRIVNSLPDFTEDGIDDEVFKNCENITVIACGTAMHAGIVGKAMIESELRIPVNVEIASEFRYKEPLINEKTLVIVTSQSGETIDTLEAMRLAKRCGSKVISIVNVKGSTIARESDYVLYTHAGPEIAVASTKAYSVQMAAMYLIGCRLGLVKGIYSEEQAKEFISKLLGTIPVIEETLLQADEVKTVANYIKMAPDAFFIGRGMDYTLSLEGALKLKEISYVHAEAYAAGELKHGTIALITENVPVIALATQPAVYEKMVSNIREVKARGAYVILISMGDEVTDTQICDKHIRIPKQDSLFTVFAAAVILQLIAYYTSDAKGLDVDKPRNLAKSVTVE